MSEVQRVVLLPRFTAFAGPQTFRTAPIDVRTFSKAVITGWRGGFVGTGVTFAMRLEESADLTNWTTVASSTLSPSVVTPATTSCEFEMPWVRVAVDLAGVGSAVTCWLVGNFTQRDR